MNVLLLANGLLHAAPPVVVWETDLQEDDGGLVPSGDPGQWAWGDVITGPGAGFTGDKGWATRLDRVHTNYADDRLGLPAVPVEGLDRPVLVLVHWHDLEPGDDDFGTVELDAGGTWTPLAPDGAAERFEGSSEGWRTDYFALPDPLPTDLSSVRLRFQADDAVARDGWVVGSVALMDGDPIPPDVSILVAPADTQDLPGPHIVEADAVDDVGVESVRLVWYTAADDRSEVEMEAAEPGRYVAGLPGAEPGTTYVWWVEARDAADNTGIATGPSFRVYLPAPQDLTAPEGRIVDTTVPLSWTTPDSIWDVDSYVIYRNGEAVATSTTTEARAPVAGSSDVFTVAARFDTDGGVFEGDPSESVQVEAYPPTILRVSPSAAWPGDTLNVEIQGRYLLMEEGEVSLDPGAGIDVLDTDVVDVDTLVAQLRVHLDATPGTRDLALLAHDQWVDAAGAFEVRADATRPRIEATLPTFLVRGERQTLRVRTNVALPEDPRFDAGAGIVIESGHRVNDYVAEFTVTVASDAALESRIPELDIGTRLLVGPPLQVRAPQPTTETVCGTVTTSSTGARAMVLLLMGAALVRRQRPTPRAGAGPEAASCRSRRGRRKSPPQS